MAVVEVKINGLAVDANAKSHVVILKEKDGERVLPIWIGPAEAQAIARELAGQRFPRPLTHDLLANVIEELGGKIERIEINNLQDHTFFAQIVVKQNGTTIEIDSRPSDAIALGIATMVPIYVAEHVLNEVC